MLRSLVFVCSCATALVQAQSHGFTQKLDMQLRLDDRSTRDLRSQYRVRYYPSLMLSADDQLSLHALIATGDEYGNSHNTFGSQGTDVLYVRRFFLRKAHRYGKTELGVLPTYKGRVSSSGLSKDGWISGVRHVYQVSQQHALEVVMGSIDSLDPRDAFDMPEKLDYVEIEWSARLNEVITYELSVERMKSGNFLRTEARYEWMKDHHLNVEWVQRMDVSRHKWVVGLAGDAHINQYPIDYYLYASYVSEDFGLRAELTEDFLGTGHGVSAECSGAIASSHIDWFARLDVVDSVERLLIGVKFSL